MEKIKTVYLEEVFIKGSLISDKTYMISFYIEVNEVEKEIQIQIVDDHDYQELYQNYDDIFRTHKGYKECNELYKIITDHINKIDEIPGYSIFSIHLYEPIKTIYTGY